MKDTAPEDRIQQAFLLHETGAYEESLALCSGSKEIALEILAAENQLALGRLGDAEAAFRDLISAIPGSSKAHLGLAEVLRSRGDIPAATGEYAEAIRLDQRNPKALREYARILAGKGDHRGAIPVQKALVGISQNPLDCLSLLRSLVAIGEADEAIAIYWQMKPAGEGNPGYIEALIASKRYTEAAEEAEEAWVRENDLIYLRLWLSALARIDPAEAHDRYREYIREFTDIELLFSAVLLAKQLHSYDEAITMLHSLRKLQDEPIYHLLFCDLLRAKGEMDAAGEEYAELLSEQLRSFEHPESLKVIIGKYIGFLELTKGQDSVIGEIKDLLEPHPSWVCLVSLGEMYERYGDLPRARDTFYRGYRSHFLRGGIAYAAFSARNHEWREAEKVMHYILSHIRRGEDLEMVAGEIVHGDEKLYQNMKITHALIERFMDMIPDLTANGREILAVASLYAASDALEKRDYQACKEQCLTGLDMMPCYPSSIRIGDFIPLLSQAKDHALSEKPVIQRMQEDAVPEEVPIWERLMLTGKEQKAAAFIREHSEANEMELRSLLGTRRVAGIINEIIRKAGEEGISIIEKRGISENGEIYAWVFR